MTALGWLRPVVTISEFAIGNLLSWAERRSSGELGHSCCSMIYAHRSMAPDRAKVRTTAGRRGRNRRDSVRRAESMVHLS